MAQTMTRAARNNELRRFFMAIVGTCIYSLGMNLFIVPASLYSGGIMGISQIIRTLLTRELGLSFGGVDIAGILYYAFNVPIFILSWYKLDRMFVIKTVLAVTAMTIVMTFVPVVPLLGSDTITNCLVGGVITGIGIGLVLRSGGTIGGFDLVSLMIMRKHKGFSVGRIGLYVNLVVYSLCMLLLSVPTAIYSLVCSVMCTTAIDRVHTQNQDAEVTIITKLPPADLEHAVFAQLNRGITQLHGVGAYTEEDVSVLYITLSEYELPILRQIIRRFDPHAFVVVKDRVRVFGNYLKKL